MEKKQISLEQQIQSHKQNLENQYVYDQKVSQSIVLEERPAHSGDLISIGIHPIQDSNLIATSSEDHSVRLWDMRKKSTIKLFKDSEFEKNQLANVVFGNENQLFVGCGKKVFQFDLRKEKIIHSESEKKSNSDNDEINQISLDISGRNLAACDDQQISYSTDFVYSDTNYSEPLCVSSGFDCKTIVWDFIKKVPLRHSNIQQITDKYMPGVLTCPPLIYSVSCLKTQILVGVESGQVIAFTQKEMKKPKYIIDAHLGKVMRAVFTRFQEQTIVSTATDKTFALWNTNKRDQYGVPTMIQRIQLKCKPNWVETTQDKKILVAGLAKELQIFYIKE